MQPVIAGTDRALGEAEYRLAQKAANAISYSVLIDVIHDETSDRMSDLTHDAAQKTAVVAGALALYPDH